MVAVISLICLVVVIDQVFKYLSIINLMGSEKINWLFFEFSYIESKSMLYNWDLTILMIILSILVLFIFIKFFFDYYTKKVRNRFNYVPFILIIGGSISNIIDRIARGFVVDYVSIPSIMKNTIFNFADFCIGAGLVMIIVYYLIKITDEKIMKEETGNNKDEIDSKQEQC